MPNSKAEKSILNRINLILTKNHHYNVLDSYNLMENVFRLKNLKKIKFY